MQVEGQGSDFISRNIKPLTLVLNAPQSDISSPEMCIFMHLFIKKVGNTGALISAPAIDPSGFVPCSAVFDKFESVILLFMEDGVGHKSSCSPCDAISPDLKFISQYTTLNLMDVQTDAHD